MQELNEKLSELEQLFKYFKEFKDKAQKTLVGNNEDELSDKISYICYLVAIDENTQALKDVCRELKVSISELYNLALKYNKVKPLRNKSNYK